MWQHTGGRRPPFALEPGPGQESVWDYPRPLALVRDERRVRVRVLCGEVVVADTCNAWRVLETASPPTFYLPPEDTDGTLLVRAPGSSWCEWKGRAAYWSVVVGTQTLDNVAWSYPEPSPAFAALRDHFAFYPARLDCYVGEHRVRPQPGEFYGGWITPDVLGPFKGEPGTAGW